MTEFHRHLFSIEMIGDMQGTFIWVCGILMNEGMYMKRCM